MGSVQLKKEEQGWKHAEPGADWANSYLSINLEDMELQYASDIPCTNKFEYPSNNSNNTYRLYMLQLLWRRRYGISVCRLILGNPPGRGRK